MSSYDYLDLGTIWKSKRKGNLVSVIGLANFDLPEKYHKTNPPQVVFTDGTFIFSSDVKRFLSLRTFVRLDEGLKSSLLELFSAPITEEEEDPSLYLDEEDEDDDLLLSSDEEIEDNSFIQQSYAHASAEPAIKSESKLEASVKQPEKALCTLIVKTKDSSVSFNEEVEKHFCGYDQSRDIDGTFYHKLSFDTRTAVEYLINNIDAITKMTIDVDGISIDVDVNYITTVYPSVINVSLNNTLHSVYSYNVIVAEVSEENDDVYEEDSSSSEVPVATAATAIPTETIVPEVVEAQPSNEEYTLGDILNEASAAFNEALAKNNDIPTLEQISINAHHDEEDTDAASEVNAGEEEDDSINVEELPEAPQEEELTNAEEISDQELLASSIVMPSDEVEDLIPSDPVSESLADKLEVITPETTESTSLIEESLKDTVDTQEEELNLIEDSSTEKSESSTEEIQINASEDTLSSTEEKKEE